MASLRFFHFFFAAQENDVATRQTPNLDFYIIRRHLTCIGMFAHHQLQVAPLSSSGFLKIFHHLHLNFQPSYFFNVRKPPPLLSYQKSFFLFFTVVVVVVVVLVGVCLFRQTKVNLKNTLNLLLQVHLKIQAFGHLQGFLLFCFLQQLALLFTSD